jgi:Tol biopolymer transport system component
MVLTAVLIGLYLRRSSSATGSRAGPPSLDIRALTESGKASRVAATPDGRYVAYVNSDAGKFELRLLQVATERDVQVLPWSPLGIVNLHFSADGNFIYFLRQLDANRNSLGVFRIATLGGPVTPLAADANGHSVTVSPDGRHIAYIAETPSESQIISIDSDGTNRQVISKRPLALRFWFIEWSPLPDTLAAVAIGEDDMGLVRIDLPAGSIRELSVSGWGAVGQPAWSPDGATIFAPAITSDQPTFQIWAFDARTGAHRPLTAGSTDYEEFTLSATGAGDLVATTRSFATTIWATDQFTHLRPIPTLKGEGVESVIWVDGQIVTSNIIEMLVHDADGRNPTKLQSYSSIYRQLARCGPHQVAYWAYDRQHHSHIARTDIVTGSTTRLTDGPGDSQPTCSVDGSTLVFNRFSHRDNLCALTRKSLDSGQSLTFYETSPCKIGGPTLSLDGTKVIFWKEPDAKDPLAWAAVVPVAGGNPQNLKMPVPDADVGAFIWAPDGKSILYALATNGVGNVWSVPLDGKPPRELTAFDSDQIFSFDVSPDNRLGISRGSAVRDVVLIKNAMR